MKKSILLNLLLSFSCHFIFLASTFGQNTNVDTNGNLPVVSDEIYRSIVQFYDYDSDIPLDAGIVGSQKLPYGTREKIIFTGVNYSRVPSYLVIPKNGASSHPVVLIVDGIFGSKERWFDDMSWPKGGQVTKALLSNGFAVMILDAVYHGERSAENDYEGPSLKYPIAARNMIMQTTCEYRRAIDYLSTRKEIDSTRIGMLGLSMGGLITFQMTSVDSRIKTAIAGVTPQLRNPKYQPIESATFASRVQCNSFLMFMGNKDSWYTMKEAYQLFELIPIQKKEFVEYDTGHKPPVEYIEKVTDWFVKNLK
ncbi:alpha/beta hydrolase [Seonamhaeicola maritimus]|nr:alpha/beta fold hydrolase [Seonamhaeicola maritimus]